MAIRRQTSSAVRGGSFAFTLQDWRRSDNLSGSSSVGFIVYWEGIEPLPFVVHERNIIPRSILFLRCSILFRFVELFQVLGRVFFEIFKTTFAAQLHLAPILLENVRIAHVPAELFARYDAGCQGMRVRV